MSHVHIGQVGHFGFWQKFKSWHVTSIPPMRVTVEPKILMSQLLKSAVFIFRRLKGVHWFLARSLTFKSWTLILANLWYRLINTTHFSSTPNISLSLWAISAGCCWLTAADWLQLTATPSHFLPLSYLGERHDWPLPDFAFLPTQSTVGSHSI